MAGGGRGRACWEENLGGGEKVRVSVCVCNPSKAPTLLSVCWASHASKVKLYSRCPRSPANLGPVELLLNDAVLALLFYEANHIICQYSVNHEAQVVQSGGGGRGGATLFSVSF